VPTLVSENIEGVLSTTYDRESDEKSEGSWPRAEKGQGREYGSPGPGESRGPHQVVGQRGVYRHAGFRSRRITLVRPLRISAA
jgi:hypothetical protein